MKLFVEKLHFWQEHSTLRYLEEEGHLEEGLLISEEGLQGPLVIVLKLKSGFEEEFQKL